jgi:hypothetical protein
MAKPSSGNRAPGKVRFRVGIPNAPRRGLTFRLNMVIAPLAKSTRHCEERKRRSNPGMPATPGLLRSRAMTEPASVGKTTIADKMRRRGVVSFATSLSEVELKPTRIYPEFLLSASWAQLPPLSSLAMMHGFAICVERPARPRRKGHIVNEPEREPLNPRPSDHRAIVGTEIYRRSH